MFKKTMIISLFLGSIILTGCSQEKGISKDETFEKQKECVSLESKVKEQIINIKDDLQNKAGGREKTKWNIDQIFYSKKYNACIYSVNVYGENPNDFEVRFYNYFTREFLGTSSTCTGFGEKDSKVECSHKQGEYMSLLEEYKGK